MNNRMVGYLTALVILGIIVLFAVNFNAILKGQTAPQIYLKYNEVKGVGIKYKGKVYTLNFDQQNKVVDYLNLSIPIKNITTGLREPSDIENIIIYQFDNKPDLTLTPVTYLNHQLVYSMPEWNSQENLIEQSNGKLQKLISETYDKQ
ncbi:MAG: hypothetical protein H0W88_01190 [Parachlamydiaceae bacterium]|nr:hypothetical protein [Parachlamydiaceae bacterium]